MVANPNPASHERRPTSSTGPRTKAGKARSSLNAVTHGLTAKTPLLRGEDPGEFRRFVWDVVADLDPHGPVQAELAHRAAVLMWKRRRINGAEQQVISELEQRYFVDADGEDEEDGDDAEGTEEQAGEEAVEEESGGEVCEEVYESDDPTRVARFLIADEFASKPDQLERLARYEQRISQQIDSTIRLLLKLQNRQDWRAGMRRREEEASSDQSPSDHAPSDQASRQAARRGAPSGAASGAPQPLAPAPAQNELAAPDPAEPKLTSPRPWTGPPGTN